jgi:polyferredoxin
MPLGAITALKSYLATGVFDPIHPAGLVILIATFLTAWIFRRALCSWVCPIGTLGQALAGLGRKAMGRNLVLPLIADRLLRGLKYVMGALLIFVLFFRMSAAEAISFLRLPYYVISDLKMFVMWFRPSIWVGFFIAFFLVASFLVKSFWCRYLCPYGAVLGLVGVVSPVALEKDPEACVGCGKCNSLCPNGVDVRGTREVVMTPECTGCTSCVNNCPKKALQLKVVGSFPVSPLAFSIAFLTLFFGIILVAKLTGHWQSIVPPAAYKAIFLQYQAGLG